MIKPGLVSITFRELNPRQIIDLAVRASLQGIEWGGDVHVRHGDLRTAREVSQMCHEAGLQIYSYGSYYELGESEREGLHFSVVLETAKTLGTGMIRIWAGRVGSARTDATHRNRIVLETRKIAEVSAEQGINVSFEFHDDTLTDTAESAVSFLEEINRNNVFVYWQPPLYLSFKEKKSSLRMILPHLSNVHVFHWTSAKGSLQRWPLQDGAQQWRKYVDIIKTTGREHALMLEYVKNDSPAQFLQDAQILTDLLKTQTPGGRTR